MYVYKKILFIFLAKGGATSHHSLVVVGGSSTDNMSITMYY